MFSYFVPELFAPLLPLVPDEPDVPVPVPVPLVPAPVEPLVFAPELVPDEPLVPVPELLPLEPVPIPGEPVALFVFVIELLSYVLLRPG
jgi:hypothetical protein